MLPVLVGVFEKSFRPSERAAHVTLAVVSKTKTVAGLYTVCSLWRRFKVKTCSFMSSALNIQAFWDLGAAKEKRADAEPRRLFCWFCSGSFSFRLEESFSQTTVTVLKAPNLLL